MSVRSTVIAALRRTGLHAPAVGAYVRLVAAVRWMRARPSDVLDLSRWASGAPARRRIAAQYRRILAEPVELETLLGEVHDDALTIVMCLWNRPERITDVLRVIDTQSTGRPLRLVLWNNQPADSSYYRSTISNYVRSGALSSVEFHESVNIGGVGRFVAMRELVRHGYVGPFITLDDDQNIAPSFVGDLLASSGARTIAGVWAWLSIDKYWRRVQVNSTGETPNHIGTGGAICDSALVRSDRFFTALPPDFLFMEDMWMSRCALNSGWSLVAVDSAVEFVLADRDQGHAIFNDKERFWRWMRRPSRIPAV